MAAMRAGMDRKTARKYFAGGKMPSEMDTARFWRTRQDPFADHWPELEVMLRETPELEAKSLFELLLDKYPERFKLKLVSYECRTEGTKLIELDRTELFTELRFRPLIHVNPGGELPEVVEKRVRRPCASFRNSMLDLAPRGLGSTTATSSNTPKAG